MKYKQLLAIFSSAILMVSMTSVSSVQAATIAQSKSTVLVRKASVKRRNTRSLTGRNLKLYQILKKDVANVASGKTSSTVFKISLKSIGLNKAATKKQLKVKSFVDRNGYVTQKVDQALERYLNIDFTTVINYMYGTEPFNLFWFDYYDENAKLDTASKYNLQFYIHKNTIRYYTKSGYIRLKFAVAKDFGSGYKVSSAAYRRAANATANAKGIVSANASVSDYNKLMNYAKVICDAVTYDEDAANRSRKNYTDPWQCLAVFDGNPKTNVVCEGYAKAFAYLCSLTKFNDPSITCNLMTGINWVVGNAGNKSLHMWDMVRMPDGKNYIVDLTNSDLEGSQDDVLVLVGQTSTDADGDILHTINNYTFNAANPHPTIVYAYDNISKAIFTKSELKVSATDYQVNEERQPVDEHIYDIGTVTKPATFKNTGILTKTCQFDGEQTQVIIPKLKVGKTQISKLSYKNGKATISWRQASHAKSYQVAYAIKGKGWHYTNVRSTRTVIGHLKKKKTYVFKIKAKNGRYTSAWSKTKNIRTV